MNQEITRHFERRIREQRQIILNQRRRITELETKKPGGDDFKALEKRIYEQRQIILNQRRRIAQLEAGGGDD